METNKRPKVVVVDGLIASGKSFWIGLMADKFREAGVSAEFVPEDVQLWSDIGIFDLYYKDQARWSYTFQTFVFSSRITAFCDRARRDRERGAVPDIYLVERSPRSDQIFMDCLVEQGAVSREEKLMYDTWKDLWLALATEMEPDLFVYLCPPLDACMARMAKRNRDSESGITRGYQAGLLRKHEEVFGSGPVALPSGRAAPVLRLEWQEFQDGDTAVADEAFAALRRALGELGE